MTAASPTTDRIPIVDYLVLDDEPHLVTQECLCCGARYFDRRNGCAACGSTDGFTTYALPTEGVLRTFTIVATAPPGVPVPYVAGVVDCGGTRVRANVVNVEPDPAHVRFGMRLRLTTFPIGADAGGTVAIGWGFEPVEDER
jgi:uncharacterized OB-fold protein